MLTEEEREELTQRLIGLQQVLTQTRTLSTGAEIVAYLNAMDGPIELVDLHIEDPVEWVKAQRHHRTENREQRTT